MAISASGVTDISVIAGVISRLITQEGIHLTLVDGNWRVIASTHSNLNIMDSFSRPYALSDVLKPDEAFHWIPEPQAGSSIMHR